MKSRFLTTIQIITQDVYIFPIAGQTAGPNGLTFFVETYGYPGVDKN